MRGITRVTASECVTQILANAKKVYRKSGRSPSNDLSLYQTAGKDLRKNPPKIKILKGTGFSPYVSASIEVRL